MFSAGLYLEVPIRGYETISYRSTPSIHISKDIVYHKRNKIEIWPNRHMVNNTLATYP